MEPVDQLLTLYAPRLVRAAVGYVGDEQEARDLAQEALYRAHRARDRYDPERPFYPWLHRILRNLCFDRAKKKRPALTDQIELAPSDSPDVLAKLQGEQQISRVRAGLDRLSSEHREILVMRHFEELSYAEIGEILNIPQGTVMSRIFRARRALLEILEQQP